MNVYIDSSSKNKSLALQRALAAHRTTWKLIPSSFKPVETTTPGSLVETKQAAVERVRRIAVEDLTPKGSLCIGIQKGWEQSDGALYLVLAVSAFISDVPMRAITHHAMEEVKNEQVLIQVEQGMAPSQAYEHCVGTSKKPFFELITGKSEVIWMTDVITGVLSQIEKQKAIHF